MTDREYKDRIRKMSVDADADLFLKLKLGPQKLLKLKSHLDDAIALLPVATGSRRLARTIADAIHETSIEEHAKDFVPYKLPGQGQGEWTNDTTPWPPIGIYRDGPAFDPFGLRQGEVSARTITERNDTLRHIFRALSTEAPFYIAEPPYYPWIENVDAAANIIKQDPCDERECECRNFKKMSSIVRMFCHALGRQAKTDPPCARTAGLF